MSKSSKFVGSWADRRNGTDALMSQSAASCQSDSIALVPSTSLTCFAMTGALSLEVVSVSEVVGSSAKATVPMTSVKAAEANIARSCFFMRVPSGVTFGNAVIPATITPAKAQDIRLLWDLANDM